MSELLLKAKKGTPEYEEWLRKFREKRGMSPSSQAASSILSYGPSQKDKERAESLLRDFRSNFISFQSKLRKLTETNKDKANKRAEIIWNSVSDEGKRKLAERSKYVPFFKERADEFKQITKDAENRISDIIKPATDNLVKNFKKVTHNASPEKFSRRLNLLAAM